MAHRISNIFKISTSVGNVCGELVNTVYNDSYYSFQGVPYAKTVVPEKRFKSPEPIEQKFSSSIDCTKEPDRCLQCEGPGRIFGSEDCLYLNIYTKELNSRSKLPVMVYLHGGGYNIGNGLRPFLSPDYFMMKNIVLITVGFRLNLFGFSSFKDPNVGAPGNAGIKDVILALKFIQENVAAFSGNPNNVTLFGHDSGSGIVQILMQTTQCEGLFHKAILMAGFYLDSINIDGIERRLGNNLGAKPGESDEELYNYFIRASGTQLAGEPTLKSSERLRGYGYGFLPVVEPYISPTTVISAEPVEQMSTAWGNSIPVIIGNTSAEGLIRHYLTDHMDMIKTHPDFLLPIVMQTRLNDEVKARMVDKMLRIHLPDPPEICQENLFKILDMQAHGFVCHPLHRFLSARRQYGTAPTYLYRFDIVSNIFNPFRRHHYGDNVTGIGHGEEVKYLFYMDKYPMIDLNSKEGITIKYMIDMWTEFAERSDPNPESIQPIKWEPVAKEGVPKCLNIWEYLGMIDCPEYEKNLKWDKCFQEAGLKLF